tara:strand:- start:161 stop:418 length:258 start_codon:yes stop_codon:yes gene_type:complete
VVEEVVQMIPLEMGLMVALVAEVAILILVEEVVIVLQQLQHKETMAETQLTVLQQQLVEVVQVLQVILLEELLLGDLVEQELHQV